MEKNEKIKDNRIENIIAAIMKVAGGDYSAQAESSGKNDDIDSLALGINMMIDDLKIGTVRQEYVNKRLDEILKVVQAVAMGDYSKTCNLSEKNDDFDALAAGLNMMIDDVRDSNEALRESGERLKAQYKGIPIPTYTWQWNISEKDFVLIGYNEAARIITQGSVVDNIGKKAREMYPARPDIWSDLEQCFREQKIIKKDMTLRFSKSGEIKYLAVSYVFVPADLVMVHTEDITDRKRAEAEIMFKNTLLETQNESSVDGILAVDNGGKILSFNRRFAGMWKMPGGLMDSRDVVTIRRFLLEQLNNPDKFLEKIDCLYANKDAKSRDELYLTDGRIIERHSVPLISATGKHFGRIWFFRDVTEMKTLQEKIVSQEKLAILGQLAGAIGHELRNPLGAVKNSVYFLNMVLQETDPQVKESLGILDKEVTNSEGIISSLLDFAGAKPPQKRSLSIKKLILQSLSRVQVPDNIEVKNRKVEAIPLIMADPYQLDQVFGHILLNALQAMPDGGQIFIDYDVSYPNWLVISVSDTGSGIPAENMEKIFTPLFTGKAKGIGLGLAISRNFIEGHGGSIEVQSKEGQGTTIIVSLPVGKER